MLVMASEPSSASPDWLHDFGTMTSWLRNGASMALLTMEAEAVGWKLSLGIVIFTIAIFGIVLGTIFNYARGFEKSVEASVSQIAHVDMEVGGLKFHPWSGYIQVMDLLIKNPEPFKNDDQHFFLKAGVIRLDVGMWKLITSRGMDITIDEITTKNMEVIIEYSGYFGGESNVHAILQKVSGEKEGAEVKKKKEEQTAPPAKKEEDTVKAEPPKVTLHKVSLLDIGMKLETKLAGAHVSAGDIKYKDFAEEVGHTVVDDIIYALVKSIAKTLLEHMTGKNFANRFL